MCAYDVWLSQENPPSQIYRLLIYPKSPKHYKEVHTAKMTPPSNSKNHHTEQTISNIHI